MNRNTICGLIFILCILTVLILLFCIWCGYKKWKDKTREEIIENLDGNVEIYVVQNNKDEPSWVGKEVAKRLSNMSRKATTIVNHMYKNRLPDPVISNRLYTRWMKIINNPKGLRETAKGERSAAYTVNKGEELRICVRDENSDRLFEGENDGFFVLLHELAHLMSKSYGHNLEFKKNFAYITKIAVELGMYKYTDYTKKPTTYCSVDITFPSY